MNIEKPKAQKDNKKSVPETPLVEKSPGDALLHKELHKPHFIEWSKHPDWIEEVKKTRKKIIEKYHVPGKNVFIEPFEDGQQRSFRLFILMENKSGDEGKNIYTEGSRAHAYLYDLARREAGLHKELPGREKLLELMDSDEFPFNIRKGFIDPRGEHFESSPIIKRRLENKIKEDSEKTEVPNWFISSQPNK